MKSATLAFKYLREQLSAFMAGLRAFERDVQKHLEKHLENQGRKASERSKKGSKPPKRSDADSNWGA